MKVWLLTNTPSPYQVEFLSAVGRAGVDLTVRFMRGEHRGCPWRNPDPAGFDARPMRALAPVSRRHGVLGQLTSGPRCS